MPELASHLRRVLELPEPGPGTPAAQAAELLRNAGRQGQRIFHRPRRLLGGTHGSAVSEQRIGWLNLNPYIEECLKTGASVVAAEACGVFLIRADGPAVGIRSEDEFRRLLEGCAGVRFFQRSKNNRDRFLALVAPLPAQQPAFVELLERWSSPAPPQSPPTSASGGAK